MDENDGVVGHDTKYNCKFLYFILGKVLKTNILHVVLVFLLGLRPMETYQRMEWSSGLKVLLHSTTFNFQNVALVDIIVVFSLLDY